MFICSTRRGFSSDWLTGIAEAPACGVLRVDRVLRGEKGRLVVCHFVPVAIPVDMR